MKAQINDVTMTDLRLVVEGVRPATRFSVRRDELRSLHQTVEDTGLQLVVGFQTFPPAAHYREWIDLNDRSFRRQQASFVYAGKDRRHLEELRRADEAVDHVETGTLLGYPRCCVRVFAERARIAPKGMDPVFHTYPHGATGSSRLNVSLLRFGIALISHVPCAIQCRQSADLAERAAAALWERSPKLSMRAAAMLSGAMVHGRNGQVAALTVANGLIAQVNAVSQDDAVLSSLARVGARLDVRHNATAFDDIVLPASDYRCYRFI